jgi:hypothetical protein
MIPSLPSLGPARTGYLHLQVTKIELFQAWPMVGKQATLCFGGLPPPRTRVDAAVTRKSETI